MPTSAELAGGQMPQQAPEQAPAASPQGVDLQSLLPALKEALQASMDQGGYVDLNKLFQIWPQIAQKYGIQVPFDAILQMISQQPEMIHPIIQELGIVGIIQDGKQISAEQLSQQGSGGVQQGAGQMAGGQPPMPEGAV